MYCIDTSSLIEGWERKYPIDVVPGLWTKLDELVEAGRLISPEEIRDELKKKSDGVWSWAKKHRETMFAPLDEDLMSVVSEVLEAYPRLVDRRRNRSGGDPFVVALAKLREATVVSEEDFSGKLDKGPRIPDVCEALKIPCIKILDLIRREKWRFGA